MISAVWRRTWPARLLRGSLLAQRISSGVSWTLLGNAVWRLGSGVSAIFVARALGSEVFGEFGLVRTTAVMVSVYSGFRLGTTATRYVAQYRQTDVHRAARVLALAVDASLILCVLAAIGLASTASLVAQYALKRPQLAMPLALSALLVFFRIVGGVKQNAIVGFEAFAAIARVNVWRGILTPLLCVPLAVFWGLWGALSGLIAVDAAAFALLSVHLRQECRRAGIPTRVPFAEARRELPVLWQFTAPGFLIGLLITTVLWAGRATLARTPSGYVNLGLFEAAYQWRTMVVFLPAALGGVILPILSETHGRESKREFGAVVSLQFGIICRVALPVSVCVIALSGPLGAVFGRDFGGAARVIPLLIAAVFLHVLNQALRRVFDGAGRRWTALNFYLLWAVAFVAGCWQWIPAHAACGLAAAHLASEAVLLVALGGYVDCVVAPRRLRRYLPLLVGSLALIAVAFLAATRLPVHLAWAVSGAATMLAGIPVLLTLSRAMRRRPSPAAAAGPPRTADTIATVAVARIPEEGGGL